MSVIVQLDSQELIVVVLEVATILTLLILVFVTPMDIVYLKIIVFAQVGIQV
jgi:hypothetical protein